MFFLTKNGLINSGLMSIKQSNKERQPLVIAFHQELFNSWQTSLHQFEIDTNLKNVFSLCIEIEIKIKTSLSHFYCSN